MKFSVRAGFLAATLIIFAGPLRSAELPAKYQFLQAAFPDVEVTDVRPSVVKGILEMEVGGSLFYVSEDGRYLFQGDLYDIKSKVNLTEFAKGSARLKALSVLKDSDGIIFAASKPNTTVTVFTDIDCGYCRKLHRSIDEYNAKGISIRYFFFPRSGPGTDSWLKAEEVWCAKDRNAALTMSKNNEDFETTDCDASVVARHYALVDDLGLSGTPALITEKGQLLIGYRTPDELLEILANEP